MDKTIEIESRDYGIIQSLITDFKQNRLPWLLRIKKKVDQNIAISDADIDFLAQVMNDTNRAILITADHRETREFCYQIAHLHQEISAKVIRQSSGN